MVSAPRVTAPSDLPYSVNCRPAPLASFSNTNTEGASIASQMNQRLLDGAEAIAAFCAAGGGVWLHAAANKTISNAIVGLITGIINPYMPQDVAKVASQSVRQKF
ncbi:MAG: hypothetical protein WDM79_18520 [Terricaulis sp.]